MARFALRSKTERAQISEALWNLSEGLIPYRFDRSTSFKMTDRVSSTYLIISL
jgi:hypothetical protein